LKAADCASKETECCLGTILSIPDTELKTVCRRNGLDAQLGTTKGLIDVGQSPHDLRGLPWPACKAGGKIGPEIFPLEEEHSTKTPSYGMAKAD
jgi:hypothetical protein